MTSSTSSGSPTALPSILLAVQGYDLGRLLDILDAEADRQGLDAVVDDVVFPALRVVGTYWAHGSFNVAHEHLFSSAVTRWLHARLAAQPLVTPPQRLRGRQIVLAAGPDDLHVLGLDCLELLLAARGVTVCNLGAQVPTNALVSVAREVDAAAVVVCSHSGPSATSATESIHAAHAAGLGVYYAGSSFDAAFIRRRIPGIALHDSVASSADLLAEPLGGPTTGVSAARRSRSVS